MRYTTFREKVKKYPFFRSHIFPHLTEKTNILRRQVSDWIKKGYVLLLKKGVYTLRNDDRAAGLSAYFLANNLYSPSFISLETALSYYGFIPERVHVITSLATKKTQHFDNSFGRFIYRHIKPHLYADFISKKDEFNNEFFIASPERALVDFFYFNAKGLKKIDVAIFNDSFRLQNLDDVNIKELKKIASKFNNKKLNAIINLFIIWIKKEYA